MRQRVFELLDCFRLQKLSFFITLNALLDNGIRLANLFPQGE